MDISSQSARAFASHLPYIWNASATAASSSAAGAPAASAAGKARATARTAWVWMLPLTDDARPPCAGATEAGTAQPLNSS